MNNANYVMRNNTPAALPPGCCRSDTDCEKGSWCQTGGKTPIYDDYYQCHGPGPSCNPPPSPTPSPVGPSK